MTSSPTQPGPSRAAGLGDSLEGLASLAPGHFDHRSQPRGNPHSKRRLTPSDSDHMTEGSDMRPTQGH